MLPQCTDKCLNVLVTEAVDHRNTGVFIDDERTPTLNTMFVGNNQLADILEELRPAIETSAEFLLIFIGKKHSLLRKSPLSIVKHSDRICSYSRTQLGMPQSPNPRQQAGEPGQDHSHHTEQHLQEFQPPVDSFSLWPVIPSSNGHPMEKNAHVCLSSMLCFSPLNLFLTPCFQVAS